MKERGDRMDGLADSGRERSSLREIKNVVIDTSIPRKERIRDYVAQIGNPYCYLDDGIVVEIGYSRLTIILSAYTDTEVSLQDRLLAYANTMDRTSGKLW